MSEVWKDISGYEGKYQVSNTGKVRSLDYHRQGIIKELALKNSRGYLIVGLMKNAKKLFILYIVLLQMLLYLTR